VIRATIWGCRGSLASPGPDTLRYGGNTSCVEIRADPDTLIVLDAGTGIRPFGLREGLPGRIHLLLTHLHLDHIEGLGFFAPIWEPQTELHVWGPPSPLRSLEERIARYLSPPLFPVQLGDIPSRITFHDVPDGEWEIDGVRLLGVPVSHPGPTLGYRVSMNGRSLAYIPDHEPVLGVEIESLPAEWISGHELARDADLLLHDAQFTEEEYLRRVGWGHSSVAHAVSFARMANVGRLLLFHHDPARDDDALERHLDRARDMWRDGEGEGPPELAREGLDLELERLRFRVAS
jgi:phosphoribosyl 1,2-cyclic phosphodiesterase